MTPVRVVNRFAAHGSGRNHEMHGSNGRRVAKWWPDLAVAP